ncbi:TPA: hypothetical protein DD455_01145 [Candidatus Shapirobacteria bacterium]|nr:hypothetical protein [Candidatus Shapirobacteria bacterium]
MEPFTLLFMVVRKPIRIFAKSVSGTKALTKPNGGISSAPSTKIVPLKMSTPVGKTRPNPLD